MRVVLFRCGRIVSPFYELLCFHNLFYNAVFARNRFTFLRNILQHLQFLLNAFAFDQMRNDYYAIGEKIGTAWHEGLPLMKK